MKIPIPDYVIEPLLRRYETLADRGVFDRSDVKVANALRLSGKDIEKIRKLIKQHKDGRRIL